MDENATPALATDAKFLTEWHPFLIFFLYLVKTFFWNCLVILWLYPVKSHTGDTNQCHPTELSCKYVQAPAVTFWRQTHKPQLNLFLTITFTAPVHLRLRLQTELAVVQIALPITFTKQTIWLSQKSFCFVPFPEIMGDSETKTVRAARVAIENSLNTNAWRFEPQGSVTVLFFPLKGYSSFEICARKPRCKFSLQSVYLLWIQTWD